MKFERMGTVRDGPGLDQPQDISPRDGSDAGYYGLRSATSAKTSSSASLYYARLVRSRSNSFRPKLLGGGWPCDLPTILRVEDPASLREGVLGRDAQESDVLRVAGLLF